MTDIDPEKLEEALNYFRRDGVWSWQQEQLIAAARAYLATLPRYKEVEFARYLVVTSRGEFGPYLEEKDAQGVAFPHQDATIVRLTGTAKVKVTP